MMIMESPSNIIRSFQTLSGIFFYNYLYNYLYFFRTVVVANTTVLPQLLCISIAIVFWIKNFVHDKHYH